MKVGDTVFQDYQDIMRYGVVYETNQKEGWLYAKVKWFNDEVYVRAMTDLARLRGTAYEDHALSEYRIDMLKIIDLEKHYSTLTKIRNYQQGLTR